MTSLRLLGSPAGELAVEEKILRVKKLEDLQNDFFSVYQKNVQVNKTNFHLLFHLEVNLLFTFNFYKSDLTKDLFRAHLYLL
jgi:hypothetical protein